MRLLSNCDRQEEKETVEVETNCKTKKIDCKFLLRFLVFFFFFKGQTEGVGRV